MTSTSNHTDRLLSPTAKPESFKRKVGTVSTRATRQGVEYWSGAMNWVYFYPNKFAAVGLALDKRAELMIVLHAETFATGKTISFTPQNSAVRFFVEDESQEPGTGKISVSQFEVDKVLKATFEFHFDRNGQRHEVKGRIDIDLPG
ncbi:hypothetical protein [Pseudomonas sp. NPDC089406]|uniref:hypothetical protein n=1 Tax=Pseudomonas sp. NPDC089406 TaxID=3364463 RepID=UPI00384C1E01